ncbi:MAG: hypothetical protein R2879_04895 [Saprospiraceae bacterium]
MKNSKIIFSLSGLAVIALTILTLNSFTTKETTAFSPKYHFLVGEQLSAGGGIAGQNGKIVGQIWVEPYAKNACTYVEHWFVSEDYVYPGANNPVPLTITPMPNLKYNNPKDFKDKMKKAFPGGHYIKVVAYEEIPGCPNLD